MLELDRTHPLEAYVEHADELAQDLVEFLCAWPSIPRLGHQLCCRTEPDLLEQGRQAPTVGGTPTMTASSVRAN